MKKRIICLILALALCLSLLPMTAVATDAADDEALAQSVDVLASTGHENHKYCGSTDCDHSEGSIDYAMPIDSETALRNAVTDGSYYLTADIELSSTWMPASGVVLCLNGKRLALRDATGAVICVERDRTFTLLDCGEGRITHLGNGSGQGVRVNGNFDMYGGTIRGCNGVKANDESAGGVEVSSKGTFRMYGGKITANSITYNRGDSQYVGGVFVAAGGNLILSRGAEITDNRYGHDDIYLCSGVKIRIGADGWTGSSKSEVNLQDYPTPGETVALTYSTGTDVSRRFEPHSSDCVINNGADNVVLMTARMSGTGLTTTVTPTTLTLKEGETATISSNVKVDEKYNGKFTLKRQWCQNTQDYSYGSTPIPGETGETFQVPSNLTPGTYYYYCRGTAYNEAGGIVTADEYGKTVVKVLGTLTVLKGADVTQPYGTEGCKVTLDITGAEGYTLSYQWYEHDEEGGGENDKPIPGATNAEYPIAKDTPIGEYYYYCVVTAEELPGQEIKTGDTKVTINKGTAVSDNFAVKTIPVYFNTATTYTCDLKDCLPDGVVLSNASYTIDGDIYCDSGWIDGSVQLTSDGVLTFGSKAASDPDDIDILRLTIKVTSANYEDFYIQLTGQASPKREEQLASARVNWTYGETPVDPRTKVTGVPADAVWVKTTYTDKWGNAIDAPTSATNAGNYKYKVEYETLSTHYVGEGSLDIDPILVDKNRVEITNTRTTYDGTTKNVEEIITVTVEVNGTKITLSPNDFYVGNGPTSAASASANPKRVTLKLQGNYAILTGEEIPFEWFIDPLEVKLALENGTDRKYGDRKGNVTLKVTNAPAFATVTVACDGGDDLSVGSHYITATGLLKTDGTENTNYKLGEGDSKRRLTYTIAKGEAPADASKELTMDVYNNVAKTYTYNFADQLPTDLTLGACSYTGAISLHEETMIEDDIRFDSNSGILTFKTKKATSPISTILSYTVTVKSDNYEDFKLVLSVKAKDKPQFPVPVGDITMDGWTYGQTPTTPSVAGLPAGVTPTFTYQDATGTDITPTYTTDAGAYTLIIRAETDDIVYTGTKPFTVAPKTLTAADIPPSSYTKSKTYDGTTDSNLGGTKVNDDACVGTDNGLCVYGTSQYNSANVAEATKLIFTANGTISNSFDASGKTKASNYTIASGTSWEYDAKIDPRPIAFTVDSVSKRFGSDTADVRVTFTGVPGNDQSGLVDGETLEQGVDYDVSATFSRTDFGTDNNVTVTVTLKDTVKARNYTLQSTTLTGVTGEIKKAAAPNVPEQTIEIYSNAETRYAIDLTKGWVAGKPTILDYDRDGRNSPHLEADELSDLLYQSASYTIPAPDDWNGTIYLNINRAFTADVGTDLGVLKVTLKSANYDDAVIRIRFKVKAKAQETLSVNLEGWTYGETANSPAYTTPAGATETTLTYTSRDGQTSYGATPPTDAGDYTLTVRCEGIDTIWTGSADFTIAAAKLTVTALDKEIIAGEDAPDLRKPVKDVDYKVEGLLGTDVLTRVALAYNETPDTSKAGTYTINITATLKNYYVTTVSGTLTILPAPPKRQPMGISAPGRVPGGTVEIDPKNATPGQTVTITVKPDKGYEIGDVTVRDIDGEKIDVKQTGDNEFTFVMPKSSVSIRANFVREGEEFFRDVPASSYYYDAVRWAKQNGITGGIGENLFGSTLPCTRAQIVTFLWRAAGSPEPKSTANFTDVPASAYYAKAVAWAVEEGITNGIGDNKFDPDAPCTRAQCVTFLYRASGSPKVSSTADFEDVAENAYYAKAVAWAQKNDITAGVSATRFAPEHDCTRAQIVTFLYRAFAE